LQTIEEGKIPKRIVLSFDGTWNIPDEDPADQIVTDTNVARFHDAVHRRDDDGVEQLRHYYHGIGTRWFERLAGGGLGIGVSRTMMAGYRDLSLEYEPGDSVFLLGFSRGAYTARALAGIISRCGLLSAPRAGAAVAPDDPNPPADDPLLNAYQHWTMRGRDDDERRRFREAADAFAAVFCRPARIAFLGVWDTVGALGIPGRIFDRFNTTLFEFADRDLTPIVDRAYHAVALDEHREDYKATLWNRRASRTQHMEQCWFVGDHCDVGGGHRLAVGDPRIADISLAWMQENAREAGLALTATVPDAACSGARAHDTYAKFLKGAYALRHPRYLRPVRQTREGNETIHQSVRDRVAADADYHPQNLGFV
jgi:uncharacterized protein (DUF2235 family)